MSIEWFFKLKEIDSLSKMRLSAITAKSDQENRLTHLNQTKNERENESEKAKQELIALRNRIAEVDQSVKQASEQRQRLIDIGGDETKIAKFAQDIENAEDQGLQLLEQEEKLEQSISDHKTFLEGITKTIQEIESEVSEDIKKHEADIAQYETRIKLLTDELPSDFQHTLTKVTAKNLAHGPFTRINNGSCYFCRYKISRIDESEIDMQQKLKTCPQCTRIFLPYGS